MLAGVRRAAAELSASTTLTRALHMSPVAAAKAKTPKKGGAEEKEKGSGICDLKVATGLNLFSKGTDPPLSPTEDYPEWLWKLKEPMLNLSELREARTADPFGMSLKEGRRLVKYEARQKIKGNNNRRSKG